MESLGFSPSPRRFPEPLPLGLDSGFSPLSVPSLNGARAPFQGVRLNSGFFPLSVSRLNGALAPFQGAHDNADGLVTSGRVPRSRPYPSFVGSSSVSPSPMRLPEPLPLDLDRP